MDIEISINRILTHVPNSTKCMTWHDVKASHEKDNPEIVIRMDDIVGMLILWAIGIGGALIVLSVELMMKGKRSLLTVSCFCPNSVLLVKQICDT